MRYPIIALIICLVVISSSANFAQDWKISLDDVYQKKDTRSWGKIYSWIFNREQFGKSFALVIGVGDYKSGWTKLEAPYYDAIRVRDFLIHDEGFDYVITLTNAKATKARINKLMEETFPMYVRKNDRFLFYYSGHGTQRLIGGSPIGYLPLQNSGVDTYGNMISMEEIERWDRVLSPTRHVLFILDCCFSGLAGIQKKASLTDKKLDRLSQYAHYLITAGTENEESVASSKWNGSLFTDSFLKAVSGRADLSSRDYGIDGVVCLKELMKYIGDRIDDESARIKGKNPLSEGIKMSPQISDLQDSAGEFFFITKNIKNEKVGNTPDKDLAFGWATKGVESVASVRFRSQPLPMNEDEVKKMLKDNDFFCQKYEWIEHFNSEGRGVENKFNQDVINGDRIVIDNASGLIWQQRGSDKKITFEQAKNYINKLRNDSFGEWRLPTLEEAMSLMESEINKDDTYINPIFNSKQWRIWTADQAKGELGVWVVSFIGGYCYICYGFDNVNYVRAVRQIQPFKE